MTIVRENCFVGVRCIGESIVKCFDGAPEFGWVGSEIYFTEGFFPEGALFLFDIIVYFSVERTDPIEGFRGWCLSAEVVSCLHFEFYGWVESGIVMAYGTGRNELLAGAGDYFIEVFG